jgi:ATP-dependent RNA helicase DDX54/DBP10
VRPAPLVPELRLPAALPGGAAPSAAALTAAATSGEAGGGDSVYGTIPAVVLEPLIERVAEVVGGGVRGRTGHAVCSGP